MRENDLLAILKNVVDEKSGLVKKLRFPNLHCDDPDLAYAYAEPADTLPVFGRRALNEGRATALRPERAAIKAICEAIERYCATGYDAEALPWLRQSDLKGQVAGPEQFSLFSEAQYATGIVPFSRPSVTDPMRWVKATALATEEPVWVPAQFVYIPYEPAPEEPVFDTLQSTGLACGSTLADAILSGLLEVIERDAFMVAWRSRRAGRRVDIGRLGNCDAKVLLQRLQARGLTVQATALDTEAAVPVIMVGITNEGNAYPHFVCGFGTSLDFDRAVLLALEEAALGQILLRRAAHAPDVLVPDTPASLIEHAMIYALDPKADTKVKFLFSGAGPADQQTGPQNLQELVARLAGAGFAPTYVDVTTPDIQQCALNVVKVLIPGMQPLDINHQHIHLGGNRLNGQVVNMQPHPFPKRRRFHATRLEKTEAMATRRCRKRACHSRDLFGKHQAQARPRRSMACP